MTCNKVFDPKSSEVLNPTLKMEFEDYCIKHFNTIEIIVPLFYRTTIGIRFKIGTGHYSDPDYVEKCMSRAMHIFNELFLNNDCVYVVVNSHENFSNDIVTSDISSFRPLINKYEESRYIYNSIKPINDEPWCCERYIFKTEINELNVPEILESIIWSDIDGRNNLQNSIFIINLRSNVAFQLYTDEGLDVIAEEYESLRAIYKKYGKWIANSCREEINERFERSL